MNNRVAATSSIPTARYAMPTMPLNPFPGLPTFIKRIQKGQSVQRNHKRLIVGGRL